MSVSKQEGINCALPTEEQIAADPSLFYSDHAPLLFEVPLDDSGDKKLIGITYNVYGAGTACGYRAYGRAQETYLKADEEYQALLQQYEVETDNKKQIATALQNKKQALDVLFDNPRLTRIAESLNACAEAHGADVILLQEVTASQLEVLREKLSDTWTILENDNFTTICYRESKYTHLDEVSNWKPDENTKSSQSLVLCSIDRSHPPIYLTNFWGLYPGEKQVEMSERCQNVDMLLEQRPDCIRVIGGDFNIPMAPNTPENITSKGLKNSADSVDSVDSVDSSIDSVLYQLPNKPAAIAKLSIFSPADVNKTHDLIQQPSQENTNVYYDVNRHNIIQRLETEITRLNKNSIFLRNGAEKVTALNNLIEKIKETPSGGDYHKAISAWEIAPSSENPSKQYKQILKEHRNVFLSKDRPGVPTSTGSTIDDLKNNLLPKGRS